MPPVPVRDILLAASLLGWYPEPPVPGLPAFEGVLMARAYGSSRHCDVTGLPVSACECGACDLDDDGSDDEPDAA